MFKVLKTEGTARRGELVTVHGTVQTPAFQNVATAGAIKGAVSALDLKESCKTQMMLCNTYHLHVRPGDELVRQMGGLHKFTKWDGPILTDSGGFQVFSLAKQISASQTSFMPFLIAGVFYFVANYVVERVMLRIERSMDYYK